MEDKNTKKIHRTSIYITEKDYKRIEKVAREKYFTSISSTIRALLSKALNMEFKDM